MLLALLAVASILAATASLCVGAWLGYCLSLLAQQVHANSARWVTRQLELREVARIRDRQDKGHQITESQVPFETGQSVVDDVAAYKKSLIDSGILPESALNGSGVAKERTR